ncbi:hypothetical protein Q7P37_000202 [Cladosporium fusiforme]
MAGPRRVESDVHIPLDNIAPPHEDRPSSRSRRKSHKRLWDSDDAPPHVWEDNRPQKWWFASTAIPLLAATLGPLANVLSIAALVTPWRSCLVKDVKPGSAALQCAWTGAGGMLGDDLSGQPFDDPRWAYTLNIISLIAGFIGNFFLLCNFTKRIRYIIALPVTIVMWYASTAILIAATVAMHVYAPPVRPQQTYHQGFWYAVFAAVLYTLCSMILMVNMLGHLLGHYSQDFALLDSHRTLILQTMLFFIWLAVGAEIFSAVESAYGGGSFIWTYSNALYFYEVTILTVGFGDIYPTNNISRGLMLPYAVGGIVMLGLVVSSLTTFATDLGSEKIVHKHAERSRNRTVGRTVTNSTEYLHRQAQAHGGHPVVSAPFNPIDTSASTRINHNKFAPNSPDSNSSPSSPSTILSFTRAASDLVSKARKPRLLLLREEKDRFEAMRRIQKETSAYQKRSALCFSVLAFALLWCLGALGFWLCERRVQDMTYYQALYFCYVCLLTIGYGDMAPKSNAGRPLFVVWSLVALPTMAFLVKYLGDTVIGKFKRGVSAIGDFTLLPKHGAYRRLLNHHPKLLSWLQTRKEKKASQHRIKAGFPIGVSNDENTNKQAKTLEQVAHSAPTPHDLAKRLADTIKRVCKDVRKSPDKQYSYEEWVEFTQMIRFTAEHDDDEDAESREEGMVEWDWIGPNSPMMARGSEAEFVLERLCESMSRYVKRTEAENSPMGVGRSKMKPLPAHAQRRMSGGRVHGRDGQGGGKRGCEREW